MLGARNRDQVVALCQYPSQGQLPGGDAFFGGQRLYLLHQSQVFAEVLTLKTRVGASEVVCGKVIRAFQGTGQKASPQRAVWHEGNAQALTGGQTAVFFLVTAPQRVLTLQCADGVHLVCPFKGGRRSFAQAQITHLACLDQIRHRTHGLFYRHVRVHAVLVVQVEGVDPKTFQAAFDRRLNIVGPPADTPGCRVGRIAHNAEFSREKYLVALATNRLADELFVGVRAIHVGGVEQVDAQLQRAVQGGHGFTGIATGGVEVSHAHAT